MNDQLPRSTHGGLTYCARCPTAIAVPRGGVKLCPECHAAALAQPSTPDTEQPKEQP